MGRCVLHFDLACGNRLTIWNSIVLGFIRLGRGLSDLLFPWKLMIPASDMGSRRPIHS